MKIGVSTVIFWNYEKLDLEKVIVHCVNDLKFEAVEIHCQSPMFPEWGTRKEDSIKKRIKDTLSTLDVEVSLHAPYHDLNIGTMNLGIREEVIRQLKNTVEFAHYLNSEIVVVHPGYVASRKYSRAKVLEKMIENFKRVAMLAEDLEVYLCMENNASKPKATGVHIPEIKEIIEAVGSEYFKLTLDTAHANTTGIKPSDFVKSLRKYIKHLHISDNLGDNHHLPIGLGNIDFYDFFYHLGNYKGIAIIEGWIPHNQDYFLEWDKKQIKSILKRLKRREKTNV